MQVSTLLLTPAVHPATSWFATPRERTFFSYWSINLGFLLRENFLLCSSYLPLGVPLNVAHKFSFINSAHSKTFSGAVGGEKSISSARGVSHSQLFYFVIVLLSYFIFILFAFYIENPKKISIAFISVACIIFVQWIVPLLCRLRA